MYSLEELQFALQELGVREEEAQSRAAAELLQLASADAGGDAGDGTVGYDAFMALQRRVGLLQAISAVDHRQAHALEGRHSAAPVAAQHPGGGSTCGSLDEGSLFCDPPPAAGLAWSSGSFDGGDACAGGSASRLAARAIACQAQRSRPADSAAAGLRWRPPSQAVAHVRGAVLVRATPVETASSSASCSSSDSVDSDGEGQPEAAGSSAAAHLDSGVRNSAVAMRIGSSNGAASSSNGATSASNGSGGGGGGTAADKALLQKPERRPPPERGVGDAPDDATSASQRDAAAVWKASRAVQGIVRMMSGDGPPPADAAWQLVAAPCNPHSVLDAAGEALPPAAGPADEPTTQALRMPEQGPCVVGAVLDR